MARDEHLLRAFRHWDNTGTRKANDKCFSIECERGFKVTIGAAIRAGLERVEIHRRETLRQFNASGLPVPRQLRGKVNPQWASQHIASAGRSRRTGCR